MKLDERRLVELAERCEKAACGRNYALESDIMAEVELKSVKAHRRTPLNYTESIDTAVSFAERVLPGWYWMASARGPSCCYGAVWTEERDGFEALAATPALALLSATLRALAKGQTK